MLVFFVQKIIVISKEYENWFEEKRWKNIILQHIQKKPRTIVTN